MDFSFAAGWFAPDEANSEAVRVLARHEKGELRIDCPQLWNYEALNFFIVSLRRKRLDQGSVEQARQILDRVQVEFHEQTDDLCRRRIGHFAEKFILTAYDAAYLELADRLQTPLLTLDTELIAAAKRQNIKTTLT